MPQFISVMLIMSCNDDVCSSRVAMNTSIGGNRDIRQPPARIEQDALGPATISVHMIFHLVAMHVMASGRGISAGFAR